MLDKQSRNLGTDGTTTRTMVVNIKSMAHVCSNTFLSIFLRRDTMVFWKMSLLHWLTKLTHQTLYREKTIGIVFWRQWRHRDWMLRTVSEIAFCLILTTGFALIVIGTWFTETILVLITNVPIFITIITVPVFMILFFFFGSCLRDCVDVLLVIIIEVGLIVVAIVVIFVALLLLIHHCFVLFGTYYVSSHFRCCRGCFCVIVVSVILFLPLLLHGCCCVHYYRC